MKYLISEGLFGAKTVEELKSSAENFLAAQGNKNVGVVSCEEGIEVLSKKGQIEINEDFACAMGMCNARRFGKARKLLRGVIEDAPLHAEAYRNLAQVEMSEGNLDVAIGLAETCLKIQPRNYWALILLGNIFARDKGDKERGLVYYERALSIESESALTLCNIAAIHSEKGDYVLARPCYERAIAADETYLNPYYGLYGCLIAEGKPREAFDVLLEGLRKGRDRAENNPELRNVMAQALVQTARVLCAKIKGLLPECNKFKDDLEKIGSLPIRIVEDESVPYNARMEIANKRGRDFHQVSYNPSKTVNKQTGIDVLSHLVLHELEHLKLWLEADEKSLNEVYLTDANCLRRFVEKVKPELSSDIARMLEGDIGKINDFLQHLLQGVTSQCMNSVEDVFVEERLFADFPAVRPLHLISMYAIELDNANSVRVGEENGMPRSVVRASKIMNMVTALNFERMWGIPTIGHYRYSPEEFRVARELFKKIGGVLADCHPGDEYRLIREQAEILRLRDFIRIENERDYFAQEQEKRERQQSFDEHHKDGGSEELKKKMACMMCVALKRLKPLEDAEVKRIAAEIAMLGVNGIKPDQESGYHVPSLPDLDMSGYELLSYYYVSWALAFPEKLSILNLPFDAAYKMALELYED